MLGQSLRSAITSKIKHAIKLKTSPASSGRYAVIGSKLKQNANEGCNSCASLAGLVLCFIACFILLVIAPLPIQCRFRLSSSLQHQFLRRVQTSAHIDMVKYTSWRVRAMNRTISTLALSRQVTELANDWSIKKFVKRRPVGYLRAKSGSARTVERNVYLTMIIQRLGIGYHC